VRKVGSACKSAVFAHAIEFTHPTGSYLCDGYELRISQRCLIEDLGYRADTGFAEAVAREIVVAFRNQRKQVTIGTKIVVWGALTRFRPREAGCGRRVVRPR
jgi:hypothetical protein